MSKAYLQTEFLRRKSERKDLQVWAEADELWSFQCFIQHLSIHEAISNAFQLKAFTSKCPCLNACKEKYRRQHKATTISECRVTQFSKELKDYTWD